jgi:hypothetical protein
MRRKLAIVGVLLPLLITSCTSWECPYHRKWLAEIDGHPELVPYKGFDVIYYQVNAARTKAYLFFSVTKRIPVGGSLSCKWDQEAEKFGVTITAVKDTETNRSKCDPTVLLHAKKVDGLWMIEYEIGVGHHGKPADQFKMFYEKRVSLFTSEPWGIELPYRGVRSD